MNRTVRNFLFFGLAVCGTCLANARVWTIDGKTKVEGDFSGIMGDIVFLSQANGESMKVPLASLSAEDQTFIKKGEGAISSVVTATPAPSSDAFSGSQPIDTAPGGSKSITCQRVGINIEPGAIIGTIHQKMMQGTPPITFSPTMVDPAQYATIARDELQKAHYNLLDGKGESANIRYKLGAKILALHLDLYSTDITFTSQRVRGGTAGTGMTFFEFTGDMTADWQVYDTLVAKIVYRHTTHLSVQADPTDMSGIGGEQEIFSMFRKSLRQLLANSSFAAFMKPEIADKSQADKSSSTSH